MSGCPCGHGMSDGPHELLLLNIEFERRLWRPCLLIPRSDRGLSGGPLPLMQLLTQLGRKLRLSDFSCNE